MAEEKTMQAKFALLHDFNLEKIQQMPLKKGSAKVETTPKVERGSRQKATASFFPEY